MLVIDIGDKRPGRPLVEPTHPEWCGQWRHEQVWIGGSNAGPFGALYVAPHHEHVPGLMRDLARFLDRDDLPLLTPTP